MGRRFLLSGRFPKVKSALSRVLRELACSCPFFYPAEDEAMPEKFKKQTEAILKRKENLAYEFTEYKGTPCPFLISTGVHLPW